MHIDSIIPLGLCQCGCGQATKIIPQTNAKRGFVKGRPYHYIIGHNARRPSLERFWEKVTKTDTCWLWTGIVLPAPRGYGQFYPGTPPNGDRVKTMPAHRFSYLTFVGPIPKGIYVCHHCDVRNCVRPDHLFLGTARDNTQDMIKKGRYVVNLPTWHRGSQKGTAKLTEEQVMAIREQFAQGDTTKVALAKEYCVSTSRIYKIVKRLEWTHI